MKNSTESTDTTNAQVASPLSKVLATACVFLAIGLPLVTLYSLTQNPKSLPGAGASPLALWQIVVAITICMIPVGLASYGLLSAHQCFRSFARGEYFLPNTVHHLRRFATGIFASAVVGLLVSPTVSLILTLGNAAGKRSLVMNLDSNEVFLLLFAGILWQIASIMAKAVTLAEENAQFI